MTFEPQKLADDLRQKHGFTIRQPVDPWLGEGLYYALASGQIAAEAIIDQIRGATLDLTTYTRQVNESLVHMLGYARRLSILVNLFSFMNVQFLKTSPTLQQMIIDLLRGERTHRQTWHELKTHFLTLIWEIVQGK